MIHKSRSPLPRHVRVTFELPSCVWADQIHITGDFNSWSNTETALRQERDGVWRAVLDLPANRRYQFRYVIDGRWQTDYHADGFADNGCGAQNSVVETCLPINSLPLTEMHRVPLRVEEMEQPMHAARERVPYRRHKRLSTRYRFPARKIEQSVP